jgi:NTE family protein
METKSFSSICVGPRKLKGFGVSSWIQMHSKKLASLLFASFLITACSSSSSTTSEPGEPSYQGTAYQDSSITQENVGGEQYGPQNPDSQAAGPATPAPAPVVPAPPSTPSTDAKLCLILGPGMAKALAEATVLEAIKKAGIPVHCVVGTEMGALVGALYAQSGSANALQWQLFKLNKDNYFSFPMLSLREPKASGRKLHDYLRGIFRGQKIEQLPTKFATLGMDLDRDTAVPFEKGDVANALSASLAMPGIFDPWRVGGSPLYSGAVRSPAPIELARKLGGNFLVLIDVLEDTSGAPSEARFQKAFSPVRNLIRLQKKDASFVISVPAGNIPFDDFNRQGDVLAAGSKAAAASVPELKAAWEKFQAGAR